MAKLSVHKLRELDDKGSRLLQKIEILQDTISRRAYDFYQTRGASEGSSVDDWLRAEREMCWVPQEKLQETEGAIHVTIGLSGAADEDIEVTLLPEMIILRGAIETDGEGQYEADSFESRPKMLFRRISFPSQIHTESAVVQLEADLLKVSAAKVELGCTPRLMSAAGPS